MADKFEKREYNVARRRALQRLAREYPQKYEKYIEEELGRSLDHHGRPLSERVKTGETRR